MSNRRKIREQLEELKKQLEESERLEKEKLNRIHEDIKQMAEDGEVFVGVVLDRDTLIAAMKELISSGGEPIQIPYNVYSLE